MPVGVPKLCCVVAGKLREAGRLIIMSRRRLGNYARDVDVKAGCDEPFAGQMLILSHCVYTGSIHILLASKHMTGIFYDSCTVKHRM